MNWKIGKAERTAPAIIANSQLSRALLKAVFTAKARRREARKKTPQSCFSLRTFAIFAPLRQDCGLKSAHAYAQSC